MSARSRLSRSEIHGVLRALRNLDRRKRLGGEVVATAGEILREDEENAFERDSATDDTRVRTAVAWLEEAVLLTREENLVQVFPSSLRVGSAAEARDRMEKALVADPYQQQLLTICETLIEADADEGISTDELMTASGLTPEGVRRALHDLEGLGIASNDTALTAFVHAGVEHASRKRFEEAAALEQRLIDLMRLQAPDMERGESHPLNLRHATQELRNEGHSHALPERLRQIVRSISADGRGEGGGGGSLGLRGRDRETLQVTLQREWGALAMTAELRRTAAGLLLEHLLSTLPRGSRGTDLLSETTLGKLLVAVNSDLILGSRIRDPARLTDRALLWLHEQEVIRLNKGLAVFRPAMTVLLKPERRGFVQSDFASLQLHYDEQVRQIHVMAEYAQRGLGSMADALGLAMDYFSLEQDEFLRSWLPDRDRDISRQTTPESWRSIVESLNNPVQRRIVADDREQTSVLVLAGPGSGKTRVLVHRIAYLVRVRRENPRGILALAYNRHSAVEIRQRLAGLIGDDARGVTVLTCHALAMRLVGASFTGSADRLDEGYFREVMEEATALLRGEGLPPGEADEYRARLLAGFRWILVDEYQDIGPDHYALISALAGRTLSEEDDKLSLFAVGDDDQNVYAFNGSSTEFIRRFEKDYRAGPVYLTDNYRSTANIIEAANAVVGPAQQRMKGEHPIGINRARAQEPPGGAWALLDPVARGRVQVLPTGDTSASQAQVAVAELQRLGGFALDWDWSSCAVVARQWSYLDPVRSLCEMQGIPVQLANEDFSGVWHLRETRALVTWLRGRSSSLARSADLEQWLEQQPQGIWNELLLEAVAEYRLEHRRWGDAGGQHHRMAGGMGQGGAPTPARVAAAHRPPRQGVGVRPRYCAGRCLGPDRNRRECGCSAPALLRGHDPRPADPRPGPHPIQDALLDVPSVLVRQETDAPQPAASELSCRYRRLSLRDVYLGFVGRRSPDHPVHRAIAALLPGDPLQVRAGENNWELLDAGGTVVGQLARGFQPPVGTRSVSATVLAIVNWDRERSEPEFRSGLRCEAWEVVVPELVFEPDL